MKIFCFQISAVRLNLRLQLHRQPEIGRLTDALAQEPGLGYADDLYSGTADAHRTAEHIGISAETSLPEAVAKDSHGRWIRFAIITLSEGAAERRLNAKHREIVASHQAGVTLFLRPRTNCERDIVITVLRGKKVREDPVLLAELPVFEPRKIAAYAH